MNYLTFWYKALAADIGIIIDTNDRDAFKQRLYAARRQAIDENLEGISIIMDPINDGRVWLVKRKIDAPPTE